MITVEKLEKGTYFDDAFKISFRYDPTTVAKVKELAERRYLPEDRAWEIPAHELPALIEKVGLSNIKSEEAVVQALNTKEIEDKREATQERLKGIKPVRDFDFKTAPLPHQIEAFNYGMEKNSLLIGDEQGLGKTKESIDICVARKKELIKTLIVCGVNSVKYNWEKEIQIHSNEGCVMVDGKTMDVRVQQLNDWYRGCSTYFPDPQGLLKFDGLAITKSYTKPNIIGYEIKVSRNDFLQDNKWHLYLQYCNEFYFVVPKGLVKKEELPDHVGLIPEICRA